MSFAPDGSRTTLATTKRVPHIEAHSPDHVVVSTYVDENTRDLFVFNVATGEEILKRTGVFRGVELSGGRLKWTTLESSEEIDLASEEGVAAATYAETEPVDRSALASLAVFDPDLTRLLWSIPIAEGFHLGAVGDSFVVMEFRYASRL